MATSPQKFPCGMAVEYGGLFSFDHATTIWNGELTVVAVVSTSSANTTVLLCVAGGLLHTHC